MPGYRLSYQEHAAIYSAALLILFRATGEFVPQLALGPSRGGVSSGGDLLRRFVFCTNITPGWGSTGNWEGLKWESRGNRSNLGEIHISIPHTGHCMLQRNVGSMLWSQEKSSIVPRKPFLR